MLKKIARYRKCHVSIKRLNISVSNIRIKKRPRSSTQHSETRRDVKLPRAGWSARVEKGGLKLARNARDSASASLHVVSHAHAAPRIAAALRPSVSFAAQSRSCLSSWFHLVARVRFSRPRSVSRPVLSLVPFPFPRRGTASFHLR